jgi:hypothetical protein
VMLKRKLNLSLKLILKVLDRPLKKQEGEETNRIVLVVRSV